MKIKIPSQSCIKKVDSTQTIYESQTTQLQKEWDHRAAHAEYLDAQQTAYLEDLTLFKTLNLARVEFEIGQKSTSLVEENIVRKATAQEKPEPATTQNLQTLSAKESIKIVENCLEMLKDAISEQNVVEQQIRNYYKIEISNKIKVFLNRKEFLVLGTDGFYNVPPFQKVFSCVISCKNLVFKGTKIIDEQGIDGYRKFLKLKKVESFKFGDVNIKIDKEENKEESELVDFVFECLLEEVEMEKIAECVQFYYGMEVATGKLIEGWEEEGNKVFYVLGKDIRKIILGADGTISCIELERK